jgi:hypothetical protein
MNRAWKLNRLLRKGKTEKVRTICGRLLSAVRFKYDEKDDDNEGSATTGSGRVIMGNYGTASTFQVVNID